MGTHPRLAGSLLKVDRASTHIRELEDRINALWATKPFVLAPTEEPDGRLSYRVRITNEPPKELSLVVGDAVQNLRAALDFAVWQLVELNGAVPTDQTSYPIERQLPS